MNKPKAVFIKFIRFAYLCYKPYLCCYFSAIVIQLLQFLKHSLSITINFIEKEIILKQYK